MKSVGRQAVSIRLDGPVILYLRRLAREESLRRDRDVTMADLIREALERAFPMPQERSAERREPTAAPKKRRTPTSL